MFLVSRRSHFAQALCEEAGVFGETLRQAQGKSLNLYGQHREEIYFLCRDYKPAILNLLKDDSIVRSL